MNWVKLLCYSIALSLAMAGIVRIFVKSLSNKRFSVANLLYLTTLLAVALAIYLASLHWSPR
ncbi:MAG TPA: hypothetical protein VGK58_20160 [Lacipirellulaceae bacterium]